MLQVLVDAVDNLLALVLQRAPQGEQIWREQCIGPQLTTLAGRDRFLPTAITLTSLLSGLTPAQRVTAIQDRLDVVR